MYLALFVTPWMIIYALSGLALNHSQAVRAFYGERFTQFEKLGERDYVAAFSSDAEPRLIGAQVLEFLGLSGTFNIQGGATPARIVINRQAAFTAHRVTYLRTENRLIIERQSLVAPAVLNRLHFRHGYEQPFLASRVWAVTVDLVIVAMVFWAASGIWMWWELKPTRALGSWFALGGIALFGLLLVSI